tara:strand:+ start:4808 stop:5020 length:213 start_codon:yes stop_codon:yes gene_type:complete
MLFVRAANVKFAAKHGHHAAVTDTIGVRTLVWLPNWKSGQMLQQWARAPAQRGQGESICRWVNHLVALTK